MVGILDSRRTRDFTVARLFTSSESWSERCQRASDPAHYRPPDVSRDGRSMGERVICMDHRMAGDCRSELVI